MSAIKRSVRFSAKNVSFQYEVDETLDKSISYFDKSDYDRINVENRATVQIMQTGSIGDITCFCSRGLEGRTKTGAQRRLQGIRRAQKAVVDEQWRQIDNDWNDPDMIAELYKGFALPALMQAQRMATRDASAARRWHASPVNSKEGAKTSNLSSDDMTSSSTETNSLSSEEDDDSISESSTAQLNLKTAKTSFKNKLFRRVVGQTPLATGWRSR
jgi:hypothetical protein